MIDARTDFSCFASKLVKTVDKWAASKNLLIFGAKDPIFVRIDVCASKDASEGGRVNAKVLLHEV